MTVVFAGGEPDAFQSFGPVGFSTVTAPDRFDQDFARGALLMFLAAHYEANFTALTEGWMHIKLNNDFVNAGANNHIIDLIDSNTDQIVLTFDTDGGTFLLKYWNGASLTTLSPNILIVNDTLYDIDIHWKIADVNGLFEFYLDGSLITSFSGDTLHAGFTQIDRVRFLDHTNGANIRVSEVIVSTVETIGWHLSTLVPESVGNSVTWTGGFADVNDTALNDATFISSATAEEVEQFNVNNLSATAATFSVEAIAVAARSRNAITGPQNLQVSIRTGAADFFSTNLSGISTGFTQAYNIWNTNPDTAGPWNTTQVDALEIGVKSKP